MSILKKPDDTLEFLYYSYESIVRREMDEKQCVLATRIFLRLCKAVRIDPATIRYNTTSSIKSYGYRFLNKECLFPNRGFGIVAGNSEAEKVAIDSDSDINKMNLIFKKNPTLYTVHNSKTAYEKENNLSKVCVFFRSKWFPDLAAASSAMPESIARRHFRRMIYDNPAILENQVMATAAIALGIPLPKENLTFELPESIKLISSKE